MAGKKRRELESTELADFVAAVQMFHPRPLAGGYLDLVEAIGQALGYERPAPIEDEQLPEV